MSKKALTEWAEDQAKEPVRWVIPDYFPRRVVSSIYAPRNAGKTLAALWLAAEASKGTFGEKLTVWVNSQEDDIPSVLRPRLDAAGFSEQRVRLTNYRWQLPRDLGKVRDALELHKAGGKANDLLILDSIQSHLIRPYHQAPAKESIMGLLEMAVDLDLGVLLVGHTTRGTHRTVEAMIAGSAVLQAESKAIYIFGPEPCGAGDGDQNEDANPRHVLACERMGFAAKPMSILFDRLTVPDEGTGREEPYLSRVGYCSWTAAEVLKAAKTDDAGGHEAGATACAMAWIVAVLERVGQAVPTGALEDKAKADGAYGSKATFERARAQLRKDGGLVSRKVGAVWWVAIPGQPFPDDPGWSTPSTPSDATDGLDGDEPATELPPAAEVVDHGPDPAEAAQTDAEPSRPATGEARHVTPRKLRDRLRMVLGTVVLTTTTKYTREGTCLEIGVYASAETRMPREQLEEWERVLRALPGVVDTKIVHNDKYDGKRVGLRDQVLVTHLRDWTE